MNTVRDQILPLVKCDGIPGEEKIVEALGKKILLIDVRIVDLWASHEKTTDKMHYGKVWQKGEWRSWFKGIRESWHENIRGPQSSLKLDLSQYATDEIEKKDDQNFISFLKWRCSKIDGEGHLGQRITEIFIERKLETTQSAAKREKTTLERQLKREIEAAERKEEMDKKLQEEQSKKQKTDAKLAQLIQGGLSKDQAEFILKFQDK